MMEFNKILKQLRTEAGYSQRAIAEKLDILPQVYNRYEDETIPGLEMLMKMARLFNVSLDTLTGFELQQRTDLNCARSFALKYGIHTIIKEENVILSYDNFVHFHSQKHEIPSDIFIRAVNKGKEAIKMLKLTGEPFFFQNVFMTVVDNPDDEILITAVQNPQSIKISIIKKIHP